MMMPKIVYVTLIFTVMQGFCSLHAQTVAWWRFDDGSGSSVLANSASTGSMYNATMVSTGTESTTNIAGPYINDGEGNTYANVSSYVNGGNNSTTGSLLLSTATSPLSTVLDQASFTIEALVYSSTAGLKFGSIFGNGLNTTGAFQFSTDTNGKMRLFTVNSQGTQINPTASAALTANTWYNVAAVGTWNGTSTSIQMYINGVASGSPVSSTGGLDIAATTKAFAIGGADPWLGYIDELRISDVAFTSASQFLSAVPEPGTTALLITGMALLIFVVRRRGKAVLPTPAQ